MNEKLLFWLWVVMTAAGIILLVWISFSHGIGFWAGEFGKECSCPKHSLAISSRFKGGLVGCVYFDLRNEELKSLSYTLTQPVCKKKS